MKTGPIDNPYAVATLKHTKGYGIMYRFMLADKINFKLICTCIEKETANKMVKLLNNDALRNKCIADNLK